MHLRRVFGGGVADGDPGGGQGFCKFWGEPRKQPCQVVDDKHLAVALRPGADADGGDAQGGGDGAGGFGFDQFHHDGECARCFDRFCVGEELLGGFRRFAFDLVAAFFEHALG